MHKAEQVKNKRVVGGLLIFLGLYSGVAAAQQMTPRTPGLWQIDSSVTMSPIGGTQKNSEKLCITPEVAKRDVAPPNALEEDDWKCTSTLTKTSVGSASYTTECRQGDDRAKGTGELTVASAKEFRGKTKIDANMEGMKVSVVADYHGRFLAADCGKAPLMKWEGFTEKPRK